MTNPYACPRCRGALAITGDVLRCVDPQCRSEYRRSAVGAWDFRDGDVFEDWFAADPAQLQRFRDTGMRTEHIGSGRVVDAYLVPLLARLGLGPAAAILSDGCGIGADVERLWEHRYRAWGGDPGERAVGWAGRTCLAHLSHFTGTRLPFASETFDFVFSEGVLEHVGMRADVFGQEMPDRTRWEHERRRYCAEIRRVLRPGGYALIAAPNRLFPIDFFHGAYGALQWRWLGMRWRLHSPLEPFLVSAADVRRWNPGMAVRYLPLTDFFNAGALGQRGYIGRFAAHAWAASQAVVPARVMGTVGPYFALLLRKPL